jgi:ABC-2 type transport system ATP-binding protein
MDENRESQPDCLLSVENLKKSYGDKEVLKGISFKIEKGEIFSLLGKNGVGKSTTIDCIVGLKNFKDGKISVCGYDVKKNEIESKSVIGYVPSEPTAYEFMSGYEYLAFVASAFHVSQRDYVMNIDYLRKRLQFDNADLLKPIGDYSHGMKQKICLMASLVHNPKIWILDEPMVGLDVMVASSLRKMITEFASNGGAVLLSSHDIEMVSKIADEAAILFGGSIATTIDFRKEPFKRKDLNGIFFHINGEDVR